jgi:hypothetical protein
MENFSRVCWNCGAALDDDARYCPNCASPVAGFAKSASLVWSHPIDTRRTGTFLGAPYDWRRPTWERTKARLWNPDEPRLVTPPPFGWGRSINFARLFGREPKG